MTTHEELHQFVDGLAEGEARELLAALRERALPRSLAEAPVDDEPVTDDDLAAIAEADADFAAGRVVSHAEARRRLLGE